jgi:hypothetical protein
VVYKNPRNKRYICSNDEIDYIRNHYEGNRQSSEQIARDLGISFNSVKWQLQKHGISVRKRKSFVWTNERKEQLQELSSKYCASKIARIMNVSEGSVCRMRSLIGIHGVIRDGWFTLYDLCEAFGIGHEVVDRWIRTDKLKATRYSETDKQRSVWHISDADLLKFIKRYPQELVNRKIDMVWFIGFLVGIGTNGKTAKVSNGYDHH